MPASPPAQPGTGSGATSSAVQAVPKGINLTASGQTSEPIATSGNVIAISMGIVTSSWGSAIVTLQVSLDFDAVNWLDTTTTLDTNSTNRLNLDTIGVLWVRAKVTTADDDADANAAIYHTLTTNDHYNTF